MTEPFRSLKLTLVGDGGVGKSCLILQYMYGEVSELKKRLKINKYKFENKLS